jgi:hypothetical protein
MGTARTPRTSTTRGKGAAATSRRGSARAQAAEAEEYEEVKGSGFTPTWDFDEQGDLVGTFTGTVTRDIKGEDRVLHQFVVDGEEYEAWGAAILNSRLADVDEGTDVKVIKTGKKIPTKRGKPATEFKVLVKKGALRKGHR